MNWGFDHIVIRCRDVGRSLAFYHGLLGLPVERLEEWRAGIVTFPSVRITADVIIDLFPVEEPVGTEAGQRVDHFCLTLNAVDFARLQTTLADAGVTIDEGPEMLWGARGDGLAMKFRDPDGLTVEVRTYQY